MTSTNISNPGARLLLKGRAYALLARLFTDTTALTDRGVLEELGKVLEQLGSPGVMEEYRRVVEAIPDDLTLLEGEHARLFIQSQASPYETSYGEDYSPFSAQPLYQMADISGFYRAFGVEVRGERPDYLVAELEFMGLLYVKEAQALLAGEEEKAQVCRKARAAFLIQHLSTWLSPFQKKLEEVARQPIFPALVSLLIALVQADLTDLKGAS